MTASRSSDTFRDSLNEEKRLVMQNKKQKIVDKFKRNKNEIERPNASRDKEKSSNSLISALFLQQKIVALKKRL
jgi:hypothetical protein